MSPLLSLLLRLGQSGSMVVRHETEAIRQQRGRENVRTRKLFLYTGNFNLIVTNLLIYQEITFLILNHTFCVSTILKISRITNMMWTGYSAASSFSLST